MTSNQHGSYIQGYTRLQWTTQRAAKPQGGANPIKVVLSSDRGLQFDPVKLESLVNAHQPRRVEYVLGSCTHRPSRQESGWRPKSCDRVTKVKLMIGTKS